MALTCWSWAIIENMAEVALTADAMDFVADHAERHIAAHADIVGCEGLEKARPSRARVELVGGPEKREPTAYAGVNAVFVVVVKHAAKRAFGAMVPCNAILLRSEHCLPGFIAFRDGWHARWFARRTVRLHQSHGDFSPFRQGMRFVGGGRCEQEASVEHDCEECEE